MYGYYHLVRLVYQRRTDAQSINKKASISDCFPLSFTCLRGLKYWNFLGKHVFISRPSVDFFFNSLIISESLESFQESGFLIFTGLMIDPMFGFSSFSLVVLVRRRPDINTGLWPRGVRWLRRSCEWWLIFPRGAEGISIGGSNIGERSGRSLGMIDQFSAHGWSFPRWLVWQLWSSHTLVLVCGGFGERIKVVLIGLWW